MKFQVLQHEKKLLRFILGAISVNLILKDFHYTFCQRQIIEMKLPGKYLPVCGQLESNMPQDRYRQTQ